MVEEIESHILKRYELIKKQGKGAYGVVYKAMDKKTKEVVALKKKFRCFSKCNRFPKNLQGNNTIARIKWA